MGGLGATGCLAGEAGRDGAAGQAAIRSFGPEPAQHLDRVFAIGAPIGPQPHLPFVGEISPEKETRPDRPGALEAPKKRSPRRAQPSPRPASWWRCASSR